MGMGWAHLDINAWGCAEILPTMVKTTMFLFTYTLTEDAVRKTYKKLMKQQRGDFTGFLTHARLVTIYCFLYS